MYQALISEFNIRTHQTHVERQGFRVHLVDPRMIYRASHRRGGAFGADRGDVEVLNTRRGQVKVKVEVEGVHSCSFKKNKWF